MWSHKKHHCIWKKERKGQKKQKATNNNNEETTLFALEGEVLIIVSYEDEFLYASNDNYLNLDSRTSYHANPRREKIIYCKCHNLGNV